MSAPSSPLKAHLQVPRVAWPTVALFVLCVMAWAAAVWAVSMGRLGYGWGVVVATLALYGLFTPMHDAVHRSASRSAWFNEALGRVCSWLYIGTFVGFRLIHLAHHTHTNDPKRTRTCGRPRAPDGRSCCAG